MKKNMGTIDRIFRTLIAITLIILYVNGVITGTKGLILIGLSGIFLVTSLISVCPLYLPFGINTRPLSHKRIPKQ